MGANFTKYSLLFFLVLSFSFMMGQEKIIKGKIVDESGEPLPGASITVKGTYRGVSADFDGNYSIQASQGEVLEFSFVGMKDKTQTVGSSNTVNVTLISDTQIEEVVVTAQGITREKKALGYAVSQIKSEDLEQKSEGDIGRILSGKASGVNITASNGLSGSATNIIIRGYSSITGSNQPLFVVDGIPVDASTNNEDNQGENFVNGSTESSRFLDFDPNDVESVNVLKGLSATVLYGEAGRNGVILINTKTGNAGADTNKKFEVTVNQSFYVSDPILPKYQDNYGGGFNQDFGFFFSNWGTAFDGDLSGNTNFIRVEDGVTLLKSPLLSIGSSLVTGLENIANQPYPYIPYNSVEDFFRQGTVQNTSIIIKGGNEKAGFSLNYGLLDDEGFTPGNSLIRNTFGLGGRAKLSNKFTINGSVKFSITDYKSPPVAASFGSGPTGGGGSVFGDLLYTPRSVDLFGLPFQAIDGRNVYYRSRNDIQNPRWTVANVKTGQKVNRVNTALNVGYDFNDWLNLTYRLGLDYYNEFNFYGENRGGVDGEGRGSYTTTHVDNTIWDHSLILRGTRNIVENLDLIAIVGLNTRRITRMSDGLRSIGQLEFGTLAHFNFVSQSSRSASDNNLDFSSEQNTMGVYADASLSYKNYLFLNVSARNDWTSTLERDNNSLLYPGTSISFLPTAAIKGIKTENVLNYLKLRFGYGTSAGFPNPYLTRNFLVLNPNRFSTRDENNNPVNVSSISVNISGDDSLLGNRNLKPERVGEFELGFESRWLNNRLTLNTSVFSKKTQDLITRRSLDRSTGYAFQFINAGELEIKGIEVDYSFDIFKKNDDKGIGWTVSGNFYADESTIESLPDGVDQIGLTRAVFGEPINYAIAGEPYGVIQGSTVALDENGNRRVNSEGLYVENATPSIIGDPNPDWTTSLSNSINYRGFNFNMSWQYRHGGDIYSQTTITLIGRGVVDDDVPFDREATYILPGVVDESTDPNREAITAARLALDTYFIDEFGIFDGSTLRLSEVSLGYTIPESALEKTPFGSVSIRVSGYNLWYRAINFPKNIRFDTNSSSTGVGNSLGLDYLTGPSSRRYGISLKATF